MPYNHDGDESRVVLEAYPGIAARQLIGDRSYKSDNKKKQTEEQHRARIDLWKLLTGVEGKAKYGFEIDARRKVVDDPRTDDLDALLCAVQAAWGWTRRSQNYGAPNNVDRLEGWICDPALLQCQE
jgi:predicted RNase H-like nuclease